MAALPGFPVFKPSDDFVIFMERLKNAFVVNKTPETDRVAVLLNQIDADAYKTLRNLCNPEPPGSKTFDEIYALLRRQYVPETSSWKERRTFFNARQKPTETVNQWFLRLKTLAINCEFGKELPDMLKTKFVFGLHESVISERISEENCDVPVDTILQIAINKEAVLPKAAERQEYARPIAPKPVQRKPQNPPQYYKVEEQFDRGAHSQQRKPRKPKKKCPHCGLTDHDFNQCEKRNDCNLQ
jgi:Retrotransposon gag protein